MRNPARHPATLLLLAGLCALLVAGCGFQRRGAVALPAGVDSVAVHDKVKASLDTGVAMAGNSAELVRQVRESLRNAGIRVREDAPLAIELLGEQFDRRAASLDTRARVAEYELDYMLSFRIVGSDGSRLVPDTTLRTDRSYRFNRDAVLGATEEEAQLRRDMRRELVSRLLRQLSRATHRQAEGAAHAPTAAGAPAAPVADAPVP